MFRSYLPAILSVYPPQRFFWKMSSHRLEEVCRWKGKKMLDEAGLFLRFIDFLSLHLPALSKLPFHSLHWGWKSLLFLCVEFEPIDNWSVDCRFIDRWSIDRRSIDSIKGFGRSVSHVFLRSKPVEVNEKSRKDFIGNVCPTLFFHIFFSKQNVYLHLSTC